MKFLISFSFFLMLSCSPKNAMSYSQRKKGKVIFFGDSITRRGTEAKGYINQLDSICKSLNKSPEYEFIGSGVSGNTVEDLLKRMDSSVVSQHPNVVVVFVGVNNIGNPANLSTEQRLNLFKTDYPMLIKILKSKLPETTIVSCNITSTSEDGSLDETANTNLNIYNEVIKNAASSQHVRLCDIRQVYIDYYKKNNSPRNMKSGILTLDGVHPNDTGNYLIANTIWTQLPE